MIGKLSGMAEPGEPGSLLLEVGGVGYLVRVPLSALGTVPGSRLSLYIHTVVRDDAIDLYGFPAREELDFFKQLMSVSGIGPKTALGILNVADVSSLKRSIAAGDSGALIKVFGIGKKSAERIVVELKDKVVAAGVAGAIAGVSADDAEVVEALMALGYGAQECRAALKDIGTEGVGTIKGRLGAALRRMGSRQSA